ncbi:hypothetical protein D3C74_409380 [compost metagenome]
MAVMGEDLPRDIPVENAGYPESVPPFPYPPLPRGTGSLKRWENPPSRGSGHGAPFRQQEVVRNRDSLQDYGAIGDSNDSQF